MTAHDALGPQFVSHKELAGMYSGDYDVPMSELHRDRDFRTQRHVGYSGLRGADLAMRHVERLAADIAKNGMKEPITIRGTNVVANGHHRALAAMKLGLDKVPVRHIR